MIEDRCTEGINPRDRSFYSTGKAPFSDFRNSAVYLVMSHLALSFVADAGAADTGLNEILNHLRRKECGEDSTGCCAEQGHDAADAHVDVNGAGTFLDPDNCRTMITPYR
jgi:hypothetical protein